MPKGQWPGGSLEQTGRVGEVVFGWRPKWPIADCAAELEERGRTYIFQGYSCLSGMVCILQRINNHQERQLGNLN